MVRRLSRSPRHREGGFTLVELLVVVAILGILAGVVVFAVQGVGDRGRAAAVAVDARILRTAEEAFCAQNGRYASEQELVDGKFLTAASQIHVVEVGDDRGDYPDGECGSSPRYYRIECRNLDCLPSVPPPPESWTRVADLNLGAPASRALTLPDGRVLNVGQFAAEIFDPRGGPDGKGAWTPTATPKPGQVPFSLTLIGGTASPACPNCGKVLMHAGLPATVQDAWYLFDPATGAWTSAGTPAYVRQYGAVVAVLEGARCGSHCGKVLVAGGVRANGSGSHKSAEFFDPRAVGNPWSSTTSTTHSHNYVGSDHGTRLADGRVLLLGSDAAEAGGPPREFGRPEIFDPVTETWTATSKVVEGEIPAVLLADGRVLTSYSSPEVFDPATGAWTPVPTSACSFGDPSSYRAIRLRDGRVLVTGKRNLPHGCLFDPATSTWSNTVPMVEIRHQHGMALLRDGRVLVAGGMDGGGANLTSAEVYTPSRP